MILRFRTEWPGERMPCTEMVDDVKGAGDEIKCAVLFLLNFTWLLDIQMKTSSWQLDEYVQADKLGT